MSAYNYGTGACVVAIMLELVSYESLDVVCNTKWNSAQQISEEVWRWAHAFLALSPSSLTVSTYMHQRAGNETTHRGTIINFGKHY